MVSGWGSAYFSTTTTSCNLGDGFSIEIGTDHCRVLIPVLIWALFCVVANQPHGVTVAASDRADAVAQTCAGIAPNRLPWTIVYRKYGGFAQLQGDHICDGLHAGAGFRENEFTTGEILLRRVQHKHDLEGKPDIAVQVLMQAIVIAGLVSQDKGCGPGLPGVMALLQPGLMAVRVILARHVQALGPEIGCRDEFFIKIVTQVLNQIGQGTGKIFVLTFAKVVTRHVYMTAIVAAVVTFYQVSALL